MQEIKRLIERRIDEINACELRNIEVFENICIAYIQYKILGTEIDDMIGSIVRRIRRKQNAETKIVYKYESYKYEWMDKKKECIKMMVIKC